MERDPEISTGIRNYFELAYSATSLTSNISFVNQVSSSDGGRLLGSEGNVHEEGGPLPYLPACGH